MLMWFKILLFESHVYICSAFCKNIYLQDCKVFCTRWTSNSKREQSLAVLTGPQQKADLHKRWKRLPCLKRSVVKLLTLLTSRSSRWSFLCWYHSFTLTTSAPSTHRHLLHKQTQMTQTQSNTTGQILLQLWSSILKSFKPPCISFSLNDRKDTNLFLKSQKFLFSTHSPGLCTQWVVWPGRLTSGTARISPALLFCSGSPSSFPANGSPGLNERGSSSLWRFYSFRWRVFGFKTRAC